MSSSAAAYTRRATSGGSAPSPQRIRHDRVTVAEDGHDGLTGVLGGRHQFVGQLPQADGWQTRVGPVAQRTPDRTKDDVRLCADPDGARRHHRLVFLGGLSESGSSDVRGGSGQSDAGKVFVAAGLDVEQRCHARLYRCLRDLELSHR